MVGWEGWGGGGGIVSPNRGTCRVSRIQTHGPVVLGLHTDPSSTPGCDLWRLQLRQILFPSSSSLKPYGTKTRSPHTQVFNNVWVACARYVQTYGRRHWRDVYGNLRTLFRLNQTFLRCILPHISILLQKYAHLVFVLRARLLFTLSARGRDRPLLLRWDSGGGGGGVEVPV